MAKEPEKISELYKTLSQADRNEQIGGRINTELSMHAVTFFHPNGNEMLGRDV